MCRARATRVVVTVPTKKTAVYGVSERIRNIYDILTTDIALKIFPNMEYKRKKKPKLR